MRGNPRPVNPHVANLDVHVKDNMNRESKQQIAARAAGLVEDNDSILVVSGSTVYAFAEEQKGWHT